MRPCVPRAVVAAMLFVFFVLLVPGAHGGTPTSLELLLHSSPSAPRRRRLLELPAGYKERLRKRPPYQLEGVEGETQILKVPGAHCRERFLSATAARSNPAAAANTRPLYCVGRHGATGAVGNVYYSEAEASAQFSAPSGGAIAVSMTDCTGAERRKYGSLKYAREATEWCTKNLGRCEGLPGLPVLAVPPGSKVILMVTMFAPATGDAAGFTAQDEAALRTVLSNTGRDWAVQFIYPRSSVGRFDLTRLFTISTDAGAEAGSESAPPRCIAATAFDFDSYGLTAASFKKNAADSMSKVMMKPEIWGAVLGENVLVTQRDAVMCRPGLDELLMQGYDYIGAPWEYTVQSIVRVGNGGFSLRRRSKMMECARTYGKPTLTKEGKLVVAEDVFFAWCVTDTGGKLPSVGVARDFAMETLYSKTPLAVHKVFWSLVVPDYKKLNLGQAGGKAELAAKLCQYCPALKGVSGVNVNC